MKPTIMKYTAVVFAAVLSTGVITSSANAAGQMSISAKAGITHLTAFDDVVGISSEEGPAFGINLGYEINNNWTAEFEYVKSDSELKGPANILTVDITSIAAYAAFRSDGDLYFIGRIGLANFELSSAEITTADETGLSYGFGGGYKLMPNVELELDYTKVEADTAWFTLAAKYTFR